MSAMESLTVTGTFMVTIGHGEGPEVEVAVSAARPDGAAVPLTLDSLEVFTALTAMFGTAAFPCDVSDMEATYTPPQGFVGFRASTRQSYVSEIGRLNAMGLGALGVIVTVDGDRGQGIIGNVSAATPQTWWAETRRTAERH